MPKRDHPYTGQGGLRPLWRKDGTEMCIRDRPYYWAMFFYYGNGYWQKGIPAQPEDMDAYEALENKIMEKYDLKEPFIWT